MSKQTEFIEKIAPYVQKYASKYGINVCSPIIAQACLESAYGTSTKAKHHNYFGLKYRKGRLTVNNGTFVDGSSEQRADGSRYDITDQWYNFDTMEAGVEGYFQFINISNYSNLKGVSDPHKYLELIRSDGYATSLNYVENVYKVITTYGLTKYDTVKKEVSTVSTQTLNIHQNTGFKGYNVSTRTSKIEFIVCHYVGAAGSAANNVSFFNGGNRNASADFFVDERGIWQYNPDLNRYYSWHCGGGLQTSMGHKFYGICGNRNSIGIEMCCYKDSSGWHFKEATVTNTIALVQYLMKKFGISIDHVIRHYDVTGKYCPGISGWIPPISPARNESEWLKFKARVAGTTVAEVSTSTSTPTSTTLRIGSSGVEVKTLQTNLNNLGYSLTMDGSFGTLTERAVIDYQKRHGLEADGIVGSKTSTSIEAELKKLAEANKFPYIAKVTASELNVRKSGTTSAAIVTKVEKGTIVSITKESNGWGYSKNLGGWMSLKYLETVKYPRNAVTLKKDTPFREDCKNTGKVIEKIKKGYTMQITGAVINSVGNVWYKATYNSRKGYVYSKNVHVS